jgi:hypothetical protein
MPGFTPPASVCPRLAASDAARLRRPCRAALSGGAVRRLPSASRDHPDTADMEPAI